jgi:hypothetical protein
MFQFAKEKGSSICDPLSWCPAFNSKHSTGTTLTEMAWQSNLTVHIWCGSVKCITQRLCTFFGDFWWLWVIHFPVNLWPCDLVCARVRVQQPDYHFGSAMKRTQVWGKHTQFIPRIRGRNRSTTIETDFQSTRDLVAVMQCQISAIAEEFDGKLERILSELEKMTQLVK